MSVRTHYKLIGAAGAAALALGALAGPALAAASSASVSYTCGTPFGPIHPSAVYNVASAPATLAVGQPLATTATLHLDPSANGVAQGLGWSSFNGTITTSPSATRAGLNLKIAKTTVNPALGGTTDAPAKGSTLTGTKVGTFTFKLGDLGHVHLNGFDSAGNPAATPSADFPNAAAGVTRCTNDATTTNLTVGATPVTIKVVKDTTKTAEKASYSAKKKIATGTAKVKSRFGTAATGKVKFTLKKGTKIGQASQGHAEEGRGQGRLQGREGEGEVLDHRRLRRQRGLKGSSGRATFTVR